jgi:ribose transport system substrate-binding protein
LRPPLRNTTLVVLLTFLAAVLFAACGSSSSSTNSAESGGVSSTESNAASAEGETSSGGGGDVAEFEEQLDQGLKSTNTDPPKTSPPVQSGKTITAVVYGLGSPTGVEVKKGLVAAAAAIGWKLNVVDGKFNTNVQLTGLREGIANHSDGIILWAVDCPSVKAGVEEAKAAKIPIIYTEAFDCNEVEEGSGPSTGYGIGKYNLLSSSEQGEFPEYMQAFGALQAAAGIVHNEGKMNAIVLNETDINSAINITKGFVDATERCSECQIEKELKFGGTQFGAPLEEMVAQALLQSPETNTVFGNYDDPVIEGAAPAVRNAGKQESVYVTGAAGYKPMTELIREDAGANMTIGLSLLWEGWASMDRLNRLFAGETTEPETGIGMEVIDAENNLPAAGQAWVPKINFEAAYEAAWKAG